MSVCLSASAVWFCSMSHTQTSVALITMCFFFSLNGNAEWGRCQEASVWTSEGKVRFSALHITESSRGQGLGLVLNNLVVNSYCTCICGTYFFSMSLIRPRKEAGGL